MTLGGEAGTEGGRCADPAHGSDGPGEEGPPGTPTSRTEHTWRPLTQGDLPSLAAGLDPTGRLEVALLAAWFPRTALVSAGLPGTVLRAHSGMTMRANSLLVLDPEPPARLEAALGWYRSRGLAPTVMAPRRTHLPPALSSFGTPAVAVMTASAGALAAGPAGADGITVGAEPSAQMLDRTAARARPGTADAEALALARSLLLSCPDQVFASTPDGAVGRLALTGVEGTAVLDGLYVPSARRRRGLATAMVRALASRALTAGASRVALEVEVDNLGARRCYEILGFETHHEHVYAQAPAPRVGLEGR